MILQKQKIGKMIKDYLSGNLDIPKDAFLTLLKVFESISDLEPINLTPPRAINSLNTPIIRNKVKKDLNVSTQNMNFVKDVDFNECVKELATNSLFLKMRNRAELEDLTPFAVYNSQLIVCEVF